ncbi:MAG: hypothetical protein MK108_15260 [Mariniblastus sp.]|nr:hypothetical protein [Mariniblastus sp.]
MHQLMTLPARLLMAGLLLCLTVHSVTAQESPGKTSSEQPAETEATETGDQETSQQVKDRAVEMGKTLNESQAVQEVSGGILKPIYQAATYLSFPAFHWCAFALMTAGVISYLLQLVLTKFFLLFKMSLDIKELLADCLGLLVSAVGLILTTQAATQNSTFTQSPLAVISAALVGVVVGFVFYLWGQRQEFDAVRGSRKAQPKKD